MFPYRSTHRSSDCDVIFKSCCKHSRCGVGNKKKIVLARIPGVTLQDPIAMKLSHVVGNMLAVVLEIKKIKIVLAGVTYP